MWKLLKLARPFRGQVALVMVLALAQSLGNLYLPRLMAEVVDDGIVKGDTAAILRNGGGMLLMALASTACAIAVAYFSARIASAFARVVRGEVFTRVTRYSIHQFDQFSTASLITRTTNDTAQVQQVLITALNMAITAPMMGIGGIILSVQQDAGLASVLIVVVPVMATVFMLIMRGAVPLFEVMQTRIDRLNLVIAEGLSGVRVIRAFDRGEHQHGRFDQANTATMDTAVSVNRIMAFLMPSMMILLNVTSIALVYVGGRRIASGSMELGAMIASLQYAMQILFSVLMVAAMFIIFPRASAAAKRINEVLDLHPSVGDPTTPAEPRHTNVRGRVEFENVSFQYPGAEEPAISGISFSANPGEMTAIIGGTGSGKTTIAGLIPRFYDVTQGRVLVGGLDVREWAVDELRGRIGYVPQKAVLFTGTVAENIRYGDDQASEERVRRAADVAQAMEFVSGLQGEFAAPIAQGGVNLSGGQKQRLSIARALVRDADIYVLDDSFSALDYATDARLRAALKTHTTNATVIVVAQRISTVINADRIVVLDDGRVAGVGTHTELLARCSVYREIVESQVNIEEVA
ncbi:MAG: ABC transporter ATP-binding protein [Vicinamibacterales bacterium]